MAKKTFDFGDNPANQFISSSSFSEAAKPMVPPLTGTKVLKAGKKDKRICVMIQSALHDDIARIARVKGISKKEIICRAVREYRDNEKRDLERYKALFGEPSGNREKYK
jgi:hypothetical protein